MVTGRRSIGTTSSTGDDAQDARDDREPGGPAGDRGGTTSTPATGVLRLPADRAEATRDAAQVLRSMVDARAASSARDDAHLLVDVVLVASTLPDPQTALYAAERLHRVIDALPDEPATGDRPAGDTQGVSAGGAMAAAPGHDAQERPAS